MKIFMINIAIFILITGNVFCNSPESAQNKTGKTVTHDIWNSLLKKYVNENGMVNYTAFIKDSAEMNKYLKLLRDTPPAVNWSVDEQKAYWINAYNAFTIQLIIDHYPVKSIKDIGSVIQIPFINTPWDIKFIRIGNKKYDLNNIEHDILRKKFSDPRIHFTLVCASASCPPLLNEAYTAEKLDEQLEQQGRKFLNDKSRNNVSANAPKVSKIFDWYKSDFTKNGSLTDFINKYADIKISSKAEISYMDYNWQLNEQ